MSDGAISTSEEPISRHPGWQGILDEGETILWQGRPDSRFRFEMKDFRKTLFFLFFTGFALFWMYGAAKQSVLFSLFGLIFLSTGLHNLVKSTIMPSYLRSRTWYTLTDRRAIIATDIPVRGRRLTSYPIGSATPVELKTGDPPSILIGGGQGAAFDYISDAQKVMALIRDVQQGNNIGVMGTSS